jgi:diaminopimelate epimerase
MLLITMEFNRDGTETTFCGAGGVCALHVTKKTVANHRKNS